MSIRVVTDSTADLPAEVVSKHNITVVPLSVFFGDEELRDGVDITAEQFFKRLTRAEQLPTTSQPSVGAFRETYERLAAEGATEILSIHISDKLSGTLESARQACEGLEGVRVELVDSRFTTLALGMGVLTAAAAVEDGATLAEAKRAAEEQFTRTHCFFMVDTLEYLQRGGRIGRASKIVGSLLKVKPLLALQDGEVVPVGRVRTKPKALEALLAKAAEHRPIEQTMAAYATDSEDFRYVAKRLDGIAQDAPMVLGRIGPVIGVHAGPGLIAIAVVTATDGAANMDNSPTPDPG